MKNSIQSIDPGRYPTAAFRKNECGSNECRNRYKILKPMIHYQIHSLNK